MGKKIVVTMITLLLGGVAGYIVTGVRLGSTVSFAVQSGCALEADGLRRVALDAYLNAPPQTAAWVLEKNLIQLDSLTRRNCDGAAGVLSLELEKVKTKGRLADVYEKLADADRANGYTQEALRFFADRPQTTTKVVDRESLRAFVEMFSKIESEAERGT